MNKIEELEAQLMAERIKVQNSSMPRSYSRTRAWGCAANAGGWLPVPTAVMSWCPVNGTGSSRRRKLPKSG